MNSNYYHTFSTQYDSIAREIISDIFISDATIRIDFPNSDKTNVFQCKGLWDTGATYSVISDKIVKQLKLPIISKTPIIGVNGRFETTTHIVDLWLPNHAVFRKVRVIKGTFNKEFDVLIGMDIITRGDFAISNFNGKTLFSFRSPSIASVDFVKIAEISNKNV